MPRNQRKLTQREFEQKIIKELRKIPDARIHFQTNSAGGGDGRDITLYLTGDDPLLIPGTARADHQRDAHAAGSCAMPRINGDLQRPEIVIRPRLDLAAQLGVTVESISQTMRIATLGDIPQNVAKFSLSDRQIPIRVSLLEHARVTCRRSRICRCPLHRAGRAAESGRRYQLRRRARPRCGATTRAAASRSMPISTGSELGTAHEARSTRCPRMKNLPHRRARSWTSAMPRS